MIHTSVCKYLMTHSSISIYIPGFDEPTTDTTTKLILSDTFNKVIRMKWQGQLLMEGQSSLAAPSANLLYLLFMLLNSMPIWATCQPDYENLDDAKIIYYTKLFPWALPIWNGVSCSRNWGTNPVPWIIPLMTLRFRLTESLYLLSHLQASYCYNKLYPTLLCSYSNDTKKLGYDLM
jgi:hypothetical protein